MPPPSAASSAPSANTPSDTVGTRMPTPCAISASSTAARIIAPTRVRSSASHSSAPITTATAMMKMRYLGKRSPPAVTTPCSHDGSGSE